MTLFTSLPAVLMLAAACFLHLPAVFMNGLLAKISVFANITLHIALFCAMVFFAIPIEEAVLAFMISLFVYTAISLLHYKMGRGTR